MSLVRVPLGVCTVTYPLVAPLGTVARMNVSETMVKGEFVGSGYTGCMEHLLKGSLG